MQHGTELASVLIVSIALAVGAGLGLFSAKTRFPHTIAVLLAGLLFGLGLKRLTDAGVASGLLALLGQGGNLSPDLILFVFLPALVFESAYAIDVHTFKKSIGPIVLLAVPALLLATGLTAGYMHWVTGSSWQWGWPAALVFGALISATDPVAVVAILRELGVSKRLGVLIEGESLLNDGTAIVVFGVLLSFLSGQTQSVDLGQAALSFVWVVLGGVLVGAVLTMLLSGWIARLFNDPMSEITLTIVLAYLSMIIAEGILHVSGVMAVVVSGLWMSSSGRTKISPEVEHFLHRFWGTLGYIANTLIFFLVGFVIAKETDRATLSDVALVLAAYAGVMVIRGLLVLLAQPAATRLSDGVSVKDSAVIAWGGLRGAVSLALALLVAQRSDIDAELRRQILFATAGVVFLTILVNGTTIGSLLKKLGFDKPPLGEQLARASANVHVLSKVDADVAELSESAQLRAVPWDALKRAVSERLTAAKTERDHLLTHLSDAPEVERQADFWIRVLSLERQAYWKAYAQGTLGPLAVRVLMRELERQLDRIARGDLQPPRRRSDHAGRGSLRARLSGGALSFEALSLRYDLARAEGIGAERVLSALVGLASADEDLQQQVSDVYHGYLNASREEIEDIRIHLPEVAHAIETRLAHRIELNLEREGYRKLSTDGTLDEQVAQAELAEVETRMKQLGQAAKRIPLPETADLVAQTPLFRGLDPDALSDLAELTEEMVLGRDAYLFREGDAGDSLYVVARGAVHVLLEADGEEQLIGVLGKGDIIGEMSLLTGDRRNASARAATPVTLGRVTRKDFEHLMRSHAALSSAVWSEVEKRSFDNAIAGASEFEALDRAGRLRWLGSGTRHNMRAGDSLKLQQNGHVFVVRGKARLGDEALDAANPASRITRCGAAQQLEALEDCRVMVLAPPELLPDVAEQAC